MSYEGSYDRVAAFARKRKQEQHLAHQKVGKQAYVPLRFAMGEAFLFDWGDVWAVINGKKVKLKIAHF